MTESRLHGLFLKIIYKDKHEDIDLVVSLLQKGKEECKLKTGHSNCK